MKTKLLLVFTLILSTIGYTQTTSIPDSNFEQVLIDAGWDNVIDGSVLTANINGRTHLTLDNKNISDLTGLEAFASLTDFYCSNNPFTSITFPNVTGFATLHLNNNSNLTSIVFPNSFTQLLEISIENNDVLTSIDFNNITYINWLSIQNNSFSSLDFSTTDVEGLNCANNPNLTSIDMRNGANYAEVYTFNATNNPNLTCVFVDNKDSSDLNSWNIDAHTSFVETQTACDFNNTHTYVPDDNFEQALIDEGYDDVLDDYVLTTNINSIGFLNVSNKNIANLTGIEAFIEVETFICSNNNLTTLDASNNHFLEFACDNNQLTSLILNADARVVDCSNNLLTAINTPTSLANINCSNNNITSLDLSNTTELSVLNCSNNNLTFLDLRNGQNTQITDSYDFDTRNNAGLTCIFVDDVTYSTTNWTNIDTTTHFVLNQAACDALSTTTTYVPDNNFEQTLIDQGYDDVLDDYVLTANISGIISLDIRGSGLNTSSDIADLTGIDGFTSLEILQCQDNVLTSLSLTENINLKELNCANNQLTTIDISKNTQLVTLVCIMNSLTNLDITKNTQLKKVECWMNQIGSIDLSNNILLEEFIASSNTFTSLDVSKNIHLKKLSFGGSDNSTINTISTLDISNNTQLTSLNFVYTQITEIDVSSHTNLTALFVHHNQLLNIDVSQNTNLVDLVCNDNQLKTLNVKNGNNTNFTRFKAQNNSFLSCIQVDNPTWSTTNWTDINGNETFGDNCHYFQTYVPDDNFEQTLIDLGYDSGALDDYVPTNNIKVATHLNVKNKNIADLTGIDDFDALILLECSNNTLTSLDLAGNMNLETLYCEYNQLTRLEFFNNTNLIKVYCNNNQLTQLNYLYYSQNLKELDCSYNSLNYIEIFNNANLEKLYIIDNQFTSFDISNNTALIEFECNDNLLTSLDVRNSNNTNITVFRTHNNPNLTCIFVDDVAYSTNNWANSTWFHTDATSTFVADEAECTSLTVDDYTFNGFKILSNPISENIKITIQEEANYTLTSINGKILRKGKLAIGNNTIPVFTIAKGIYFLKVSNTVRSSVTKLIIK